MKRLILCLCLLSFSWLSQAQERWSLRQCVEYAIANNISIKQSDLQARFAQLDHELSRGAQLPTLNFGTNTGLSFGRRENPTTGVFENQNFFSTNFNLQSSVTIFNWFAVKHTIEANRLSVEAGKAQTQKVRDDVALNVAVAYLQALLAREQANITSIQIRQTTAQLESTRKQVDAGKLPELNAAELEAQLARDSSSYITAQSTAQQYLLQLKALLNLDAAAPFGIETLPIDLIPVENIAELQPEAVYNLALANLPQQKVNDLRIQSATRSASAARANLYPSVSAFANLGTNYIYFRQPLYGQVITGFQPTGFRVNAGGTLYPVEAPVYGQGDKMGYFTPNGLGNQLSANFGQGVGIGVQVPILNGKSARINLDRAKLNIKSFELQKDLDCQTLKQDIYRAYNDAVTALQKFHANRKTVETAARAFGYAEKRYGLGLVSTYDLMNSQNNLQRARIELLYAQFDYVFRMKLLEFYKGQGLKL
jgi:outer membrane protein